MNEQNTIPVANLRQEVVEGKDVVNKNIEEMAHQKAIEAIKVYNLNELIQTLKY